MSNLRSARLADIPRIVELGKKFLHASAYDKHFSENAPQMQSLAERLLNGEGDIIVSERNGVITGMLGFIVYPHHISGELVAGEVFWWVEPDARGDGIKLMHQAESMAQYMGATKMQMIAPTAQVGSVYQRLGYEFIESAYQRTF